MRKEMKMLKHNRKKEKCVMAERTKNKQIDYIF